MILSKGDIFYTDGNSKFYYEISEITHDIVFYYALPRRDYDKKLNIPKFHLLRNTIEEIENLENLRFKHRAITDKLDILINITRE